MIRPTIEVLYSCRVCGIRDAALRVPAREEEEVLAWMDATIALVGADHYRRSPACGATRLQDLKIPMTGVDRIGGAARH